MLDHGENNDLFDFINFNKTKMSFTCANMIKRIWQYFEKFYFLTNIK